MSQDDIGYLRGLQESTTEAVKDMKEDMREMKNDVKAIMTRLDAGAIQSIQLEGRVQRVEKSQCPAAGACISLEKRINIAEADIVDIKNTKRAAHTVWSFLGVVSSVAVGILGAFYVVTQIIEHFQK